MTTSVDDIFRRTRHLLQDSACVRWSDEELLLWLNEAQQMLAVLKPDAVAVSETMTCANGTRQELPAGGLQLFDVVKNGTGRVVRRVERKVLDAENPLWHSDTGTTNVRWFTYDGRTPTVFYLCPPATDATTVDLLYAKMPTALTRDALIGVEDVYAAVLIDYVCFRAYSKDSDYNPSAERAKLYLDAFNTTLGVKQVVEVAAVAPAGEASDAVQ